MGSDVETGMFDGLLASMLENLGDHRVASALQGPCHEGLKAAMRTGLVAAFETAVSTGEEPFEGLPEDIANSSDPSEALTDWVENEAGQHAGALAAAMAAVIGGFVASNRAAVISAMKAAGQGPAENRQEQVVDASALINIATSGIEAIPGIASLDDAVAAMEEARSRLEEARDILFARILDDAVVYGANPDTAQGGGDDIPELTPRGRRTDVENLLFDSWMCEVDGHLALAAKVGPEVDGSKVVDDDQRDFILDALVAVQEAYTARPDTAVLLKFGRLRLAKGDVGEARMAAEKVMELVPDDNDPLHQAAVALYDDVTQASPLTRRDKRCFIATAAMDDVDAPEVETLRAFRDAFLMKSAPGRLFVRTYYRVSPPLAALVAESTALRLVVRRMLVVPAAGLAGKLTDNRSR